MADSLGKPDTILIAITMEDDSVAIMQFVTAERDGNGDVRWEREGTVDEINAEIAKAFSYPNPEPNQQPKTWRLIEPGDLPQSRADRAHWRDDGAKIVVRKPSKKG